MQPVNTLPQQLFDPYHVVAQPVVSRVGDDRVHRRRVDVAFHQRIVGNRRFTPSALRVCGRIGPMMPKRLRVGTR